MGIPCSSPCPVRPLSGSVEGLEQRLQMSAFDLMHPDDMPAVREALGRVVSGAVDALTMEVRFQHRDGDWRHIEAATRPWVRGGETFVLVNVRDVTDRHRSTQAR